MRDGVRLSADVYLPAVEGRYPVILQRTPYNNNERWIAAEAKRYTGYGYAYVAQDCRGKYDSDGDWYPYIHEAADGDDTLTWCGRQPWSDGRIGMTGGSYCGTLQWYAAAAGNPYLKCIAPMVSFSDLFYDHGLRRDGVFQTFFIHWSVAMAGRTFFAVDPERSEAAEWHVPLETMDRFLGFDLPYWKDFVRHETYDEFWRALSIRGRYGDIDVPALSIGGWYSPWELRGVLANFNGMRQEGKSMATRRHQRLVVGPWSHRLDPSQRIGEVGFGAQAAIEIHEIEHRWFDRWLKGEENGIDDEPRVRIFVTGADEWREEWEWPLERARPVSFYLGSGGHANSLLGDGTLSQTPPAGDEPADAFTYNPKRPVPALLAGDDPSAALWMDQRPKERRDDVLVYTTAPLVSDLEVIGHVRASLYAATSAPDTDFVATLVDVHPDGLAVPLTWGITRGRYLTGHSDPQLLDPGRIYEWAIDLWALAHVFRAGHHIRVEVTSSFFPFFGRNHNTGHPTATDTDFALAEQSLHHSEGHPSHIVLPVMAAEAGETV